MSEAEITIYITNSTPGAVASKVSGYFTFRGQTIRFKAIAFGRIGGHNINVKIAKKNEENLRKIGIDPEELIVTVQRKIILGDMIMPETRKDEINS